MRKLIPVLVSTAILAAIYAAIDLSQLLAALARCNRLGLVFALTMVVPLTFLTAWRLAQLTPASGNLALGEATRLTLAASVLNMVLPSKMGDLAKAYFMRQRCGVSGDLALTLVVFEKTLDTLALLAWCVFGLTLIPDQGAFFWYALPIIGVGLLTGVLIIGSPRTAAWVFVLAARFVRGPSRALIHRLDAAWVEMQDYLWRDRRKLLLVSIVSLLLWLLHLLQIWFFILALNAWTPIVANLALAPLAILAGLAPLTFAGVGTRDAALIFFYKPYLSTSTAAALGLLCTLRYALPALAGLPFLHRYLVLLRRAQAGDFQTSTDLRDP
jgi:uncharacterized protein (TIRG00374 family)